jgi:hypothetical protein
MGKKHLGLLCLWTVGLIANPLKSGCIRSGWVKVVSVGLPSHASSSGLCEHRTGRIFYRRGEEPVAEALWCDPLDHSYYLRDANRRIVLASSVRASIAGFLALDGSISSAYWEADSPGPLEPLIWQDWEEPIAMSADSRIVIGESKRVFWVPEFNGILGTPISWSNLGWITLRLCLWSRAVEQQLLNVVPFSAAHAVLAQSHQKEGELHLAADALERLAEQGHLVRAPLAASRSRLQSCTSTSCPSPCRCSEDP